VVHYSDTAPSTPEKAEHRKLQGSVIETSDPDYATRVAMKKSPIALYTAPSCKEALLARARLAAAAAACRFRKSS